MIFELSLAVGRKKWGQVFGFGNCHFEAIMDLKEVCDCHLSDNEDILESLLARDRLPRIR